MRYIIVGSSTYKTFTDYYKPQDGDYLIGLDEASMDIINSGFVLSEAWGDFDSGSSINIIKEKSLKFYKFPSEKNETDLELVLMNLNTLDEIFIYNVTGGRLDHELVNLLLLRKYKHLNLRIIDKENEIRYISTKGKYIINQEDYNYISLLTLDEAVIKINKAKYLLDKTTINKNDTYTTSNQFIGGIFEFELFSGELIIIRSK